MQVSQDALALLFHQVRKPSRYIGQEWNSIEKDWRQVEVTIALAYPDLYEVGMSNLGLSILYDRVNQRSEYVAERVFAPWDDMAEALRASDTRLYSLETRHTLDSFDILGFSLQYELTYSNVLDMLDLGGLPMRAADRSAEDPVVIAGGSCAYNPEPMADFVDAFVIGEGEQVLLELMDAVRDWKAEGGRQMPGGRDALLHQLSTIPGVYVPSLYRPTYGPQGRLTGITPVDASVPGQVRKRIVPELGPVPMRPIVPHFQVVHDRGMVEIQRGCSRGCRFCQAGIVYRPIRERSVPEVLEAIDCLMANTGYDEVGLVSLSSGDHSGIEEIVSQAMARHADDGLAISLPSLRIDSFSVKLAKMIQTRRKTGFTFAPEAGSQRLRDVINKGVTEEDLLRTAEAAFANGWNRIKLYFMLGLPSEEDQDLLEVGRLIRDIYRLGRNMRGRRIEINVSVSTFVPKPFTPFQWEPLLSQSDVERRQQLLLNEVHLRGVRISWSDWDQTWLEALMSRGDRRLGAVIQRAWELGARFDAWGERFKPEIWRQALLDQGIDSAQHTTRERAQDEVLPWAAVDVGVTESFLWRERERALTGQLSDDCRRECHGCGIIAAYGETRAGLREGAWGCPP